MQVEDPAAKHCSKEGPHCRLGAKREEAVKDKQQSTYSPVWISFGDSIVGLYCVAWLTQESVSSRIFVRKKGMNNVQSNGRSQQTLSADSGKGKSRR
jgi:hypothetical protein